MKEEFKAKATRIISRASLQLRKHSPEILLVTGLVGTVVGTVMACKATTKVQEIKEAKERAVDDVHTALNDPRFKKEYNDDDAKRDLALIYTQTGLKLAKLYAPAAGVMVASFASIIAGHKILSKRNVAIAAAYTALDQTFKKYRENVIEKYGEGEDQRLRFGIKSKEIKEKGKDGKTKKEEVDYIEDDILKQYSEYSRFFDETCKDFAKDPEYNQMFLRRQQDYANEMLKAKGHLFLNEVYDLLDIPRSKAGQVVGWIYDPKNPIGDNYVDFGIYNNHEASRRFVNGLEKVILLDFNVDGIIWDKI